MERLNAKDDFTIREPSLEEFVKNKDFLIVDDIYTTGSTIHQIAEILKQYGANRLFSFTLFRS